MALFDPNLRGRWIKLGVTDEQPSGFIKLSTIARAKKKTDAQGEHVEIVRKGGKPIIKYRGPSSKLDHVKKQLEKEGIGEV